MQDAQFKRLRDRVFALSERQAYAEALALIDEHAEALTQFESDLLFWRACLYGRLGNRSEAIRALQSAAERGHWYHERMLRDPDLDIIRDSAELADLQRLFNERHQQAQAEAKPERQVWEPAGQPCGLLVALHGAGGSILTEGDYWRQAVQLGWRVAMLQSSQVFAPRRYHWQDAAKAIEEVRRHLEEIGEGSPIVLAGFSMGGGLAIRATLSGSIPACGFLAVAPSFRMEQMGPLVQTAPRGVRGYVVVGTEDWCYGPAKELALAMKQAGLACDVEEHPGLGHDYPNGFGSSLRRGLSFLHG